MNKSSSVILPALLLLSCALLAAQDPSADQLIAVLTHATDEQRMGLIGNACQAETERLAALRLAYWSDTALPKIEKLLDAVEAGPSPWGANWLELAYARIKGSDAFSRLRRLEMASRDMASRETFGDDFGRRSLDRAIALSLGLTSFISSPTAPVPHFPDAVTNLCGCAEPRDALDRFIRGLERNAADQFRSRRDLAIGYRFEAPGPWSDPPETLDYKSPPDSTPPSAELITHLTTQSGADCGSYAIQFALTPPEGQRHHEYYSVSNPNLADLTNLITACLARQ
jgi:hypothetical protein